MKSKIQILFLTAIILVTAFTGCATQKSVHNPAGIPNPMTEITAAELTEKTGVALDAPAGATDVKYFTIRSEGDALMAEVRFTLDGKDYRYRAIATDKTEAFDIAGIFASGWKETEAEVGYCKAIVRTSGDNTVVNWLDVVPGVNYSMACCDASTEETVVKTAQQSFVPMQGETG